MAERRPLVLVNGQPQELPVGDTLPGGGSAPPPADSIAYTYTDGRVTSVTKDGATTTITYNMDGTVNTVSYPHAGKTRTETYSYSGGLVSGMTANEA